MLSPYSVLRILPLKENEFLNILNLVLVRKISANEMYLRSEGFRTRPPVADD